MKHLTLTKGFVAIVDDDDYERVNQWKWHVSKGSSKHYVVRTVRLGYKKRGRIALHRLLLGITDPNIQVDHINGDTMDNRKCNLRECLNKDNTKNRKSRTGSTSKFLGVHIRIAKKTYMTRRGLVTNIKTMYVSKIRTEVKEIYLGAFPYTPEGEILAAKAYDAAALIHHKEFANPNFK